MSRAIPTLSRVRTSSAGRRRVTAACAAALATAGLRPPPVAAITFNLTYDSSITGAANAAQIEAAVQYVANQYSSLYTAPGSINILTYQNTTTPPLGGSFTGGNDYTYAQVKAALASHIGSPDQALAYSSLPATDPTNGGSFYIPYAQQRMLGLHSAVDSSISDGHFAFNSTVPFTFDPNNRAVAGKYDFIGTAEHEFSEILGRSSGLGSGFYTIDDLYRYQGSGAYPGNGTRSLSTTDSNATFSLDGGHTALHGFNNAYVNGGDYADWDSSDNDSYNAFSAPSVVNGLSTEDVRELDVLGGDRGVDATDVFWKFATPGAYATAGNWVSNRAPGTADTAQFRLLGSPYTVTLGANVTTAGLYVHDNTVTINLAGHTWTQTNGSADPLIVGQESVDYGLLAMSNGAVVTNPSNGTASSIGQTAGNVGVVSVGPSVYTSTSATPATWTNNGPLYVGEGGSGRLEVSGGSTLTTFGAVAIGKLAGSSGILESSGTVVANNVEEHVGEYGSGSLVTSGSYTVNANLLFGVYAGSVGSGVVAGGTLTNSGYAFVGYSGTGSVQVQSGGTQQVNGNLILGTNAGAIGSESMADPVIIINAKGAKPADLSPPPPPPQVNVTGQEVIGNLATGTASQPGATFNQTEGVNTAASVLIAQFAGSTAVYQISGGSLTSGGNITVGEAGTGKFNQSGGTVTTGPSILSAVTVGDGAGGVGTYSISGAAALNTSFLYAGNTGSGSINVTGGTVTASQAIELGYSAGGIGTLLLNGGTTTTSSGLIVGGTGTGTVTDNNGSFTGEIYLGFNAPGVGTYTLSGFGSLNQNQPIIVGESGTGTFNMAGGSLALTPGSFFGSPYPTQLNIADQAGSHGLFLQSGGTSSVGFLNVGISGTGVLNQSAGSQTVSSTLTIASQNGSNGSVIVTGGSLTAANLTIAGSTGATGSLAYSGSGSVLIGSGTPAAGPSLTIASGASVTTVGTASINANGSLDNYGQISVTGGSFTYTGTQALLNHPAANIQLSNGATARFTGATGPLNEGNLAASAGTTLALPVGFANVGSFLNAGTLQGGGTFTNSGTFSQTGPQSWAAGAQISSTGGSLTLSTDAGSTTSATLNITLLGSGLGLGSTEHLQSLYLSGGAFAQETSPAGSRTLLATGSLTFAGGPGAYQATLNLGSNDLLVHNGSLAALSAAAAEGYAGGTWNGSGGVVSYVAATDPRHLTAIGVIQNLAVNGTSPIYTTFDGTPATANDVLARYTYYGDTNLDGGVNGADYSRIDAGLIGHLTGWANGDFNYDGAVDGSDYTLMDNAFNQQAGGVGAPAALVASATAELAAVPEPASLALATAAASLVLSRRRRWSAVRDWR